MSYDYLKDDEERKYRQEEYKDWDEKVTKLFDRWIQQKSFVNEEFHLAHSYA